MNRFLVALATLLSFSTLAGHGHAQSAKHQIVIGISVLTTNNPFFVEMAGAMKDEGGKHGATVMLTSAELDIVNQREQVSDFISKRVSAIVLCPADSRAIGTAIAAAHEASIPVFTADIAAIEERDKVVCHIATDNLAGGREAGNALIQAIGGNGKVAILDHPEVESVMLRTKGFREALEEHNGSGKGKVEIVATIPCRGGYVTSWAQATQLLKDHPDLSGIFAINDPSALGAVLALEKAGKLRQVKVIGFDALPQGKQAIKDGKIWGDPIQFPEKIGRQTIQIILKHLDGEIVPKAILFPTVFYTKTDAEKDASLK